MLMDIVEIKARKYGKIDCALGHGVARVKGM